MRLLLIVVWRTMRIVCLTFGCVGDARRSLMMKKRRRNAARIKAEQRQITFNRRPGQGGKGGRGMEKVIGEGILAKRMLLQKQQGWDHYRNMAVYAIHAYNVCDGCC